MVYIIGGGGKAELGGRRSGGVPPSLPPALRGPRERCGGSLLGVRRLAGSWSALGWLRTAVPGLRARALGETSRCPAGIAASGREKATASPTAAALCSGGREEKA